MNKNNTQKFSSVRIESRGVIASISGVTAWVRRIVFVARIAWRYRDSRMVRYFDVRAGHEVIEFVKDSGTPAVPTPKGVGRDLSKQNRGGRG